MKVLFYIYDFGIGGAETLTANYMKRLKEKGVDVFALVGRHATNPFLENDLINCGIKIFFMKPNNESILHMLFRKTRLFSNRFWKKVINEVRPDLIHINSRLCDMPKHILKHIPVVFSFHTDVDRHLRIFGKKEKKQMDYCVNHGMSFFAISNVIRERIHELYPNATAYYVPNGVDILAIRESHYTKEDFLKTINVPTDAFIVGHVGRFNKVKNHSKVLSVFKEIHNQRNNAFLILVGSGTEEETKDIQNKIGFLGLNQSVVMLGTRDDVSSLVGVFDVFLFPSFSEGFPLSMIEAQSAGVRCIASTGVPQDVICTDNSFRLDLNTSDKDWAELALSNEKNNDYCDIMIYEINHVVDDIINYYNQISSR